MANIQKANRKKDKRRWFFKRKGFWLGFVIFAVLASIGGFLFVDGYTKEYRNRAASYDLARINDLEEPSIILDRNDKEIGRIFLENRSIVTMQQVPKKFVEALVAGEDSRFWTHSGVDFIGTVRALLSTFRGSSQGGSTITQQLARNAYNLKGEALRRHETTIQRKLVEAFLSRRIEQKYKKEEILGFYLNRIFFGKEFYGLRSASLGYFGKEPLDLTTEQCASLVALIKSPNPLSPLNNPEGNLKWRNFVLMRMKEEGTLTKAEMKRCQAQPLGLDPKPLRRGTTHLYERIFDEVRRQLGEDALAAGGFKIHTTILAEAQEAAQTALAESLAKAENHPGYSHPRYQDYKKDSDKPAEYLQGAALVVDHQTGEVLAHVGGRDYAQVPYDFIESGKKPLGTAFFPFLYATGLRNGQTPAAMLTDEPMDNREVMIGGQEGIPGEWGMEVTAPKYKGQIPMREAFENSKIGATVRFANQVGLQRIVDTSVAFGLPLAKAELLPRLAVGFEEVGMKQAVAAMSVFPLGGQSGAEKLVYLDRVEDSSGHLKYRREHIALRRHDVIDDATAWQVHSMMAGSLDHGSSQGALTELVEKEFSGAGKGGSTFGFSDTWFIGYNKRITCGVWTGFLGGNSDAIYPGAFSRDLSMPVWEAAMNAAAPSFGGEKLTPPQDVVQLMLCATSGQRATQFCQEHVEDLKTGVVGARSTAFVEYFRKGTENLPFCTIHSGTAETGVSPDLAIYNLPALDAVPIRPKDPVLLGDDPYHTDMPSYAVTSGQPGFIRSRSNVLDSLDLGVKEEIIPLERPPRLEIRDNP